MRYERADASLRRLLAAEGLPSEALEPWPAWKAFKRFVREPVEDDRIISDALVQYGREEEADGGHRAYLRFVREFSLTDVSTGRATEGDKALTDAQEEPGSPLTHVICELEFPADALDSEGQTVEFWTQDAPSWSAFVDRVEADPGFQRLVNLRPERSAVYAEEA